jgi:hypothetical protein
MAEDKDLEPGVDKIVAEAKKLFKICQDADAENRTREIDDLEFYDGQDGKQWGSGPYAERIREGRPALTINRMGQFAQHITNALSQQRISARVFPVDDVADPETAEVIQGHLRHIENNSDAQLAYGTAAFYAVVMGRGYWMLRQQFCSAKSFDTEITIERVSNPFQIYLDPNHRHPSGKDAEYGFKFTTLSREEYERLYPGTELCTADWIPDDDKWIDEDNVRVAEFYKIEYKPDTLVKLKDGTAALKSEMSDEDYNKKALSDGNGKKVERKTQLPTVRHYVINGVEVLESTVWPTSDDYVSLPIIKEVGNELDINGKQVLKGIIRDLKDAQRQYNFMLTSQTEAIDSSRGPIVIEDGQVSGHEQEWVEAAKRKVLHVTGKNIDGQQAKDPFRLQPNQSIASMTEARLMAADDLKALTGIYDAALGQKSNETSGVAIRGRQAQSDTANFHFTSNHVRSVNHSCRLIVGSLPIIYDTPRSIRIVGEDEAENVVKVNQDVEEVNGQRSYRIGGHDAGKYDVVCEAGPSTSTKREQDSALLTELVKVYPPLMEVAADKILKAVGAPMDVVERVEKAIPPQFQDKKDGQPDPQQLMAENAQLKGQMQQMGAELQDAQNPMKVKQLEIQDKEAQRQHDREITSAKFEHDLQMRRMDIELAAKTKIAELDHKEELEIYKTEAMLKSKQIDRDAAAQQQEMQEAKATVESM